MAVAAVVYIIINYILSIFALGSFGIWIYLSYTLINSIRISPMIPSDKLLPLKNNSNYLVSIIIPARNEEKYIGISIKSLLDQKYINYEIIVVDDNSTDKTLEILRSMEANNDKLKVYEAGLKPDDWVGKNWPCYMGYTKSKGDFLFFTDADTIHSKYSICNSLSTILDQKLDVLTAIPKLLYPTISVKMVLPVLSIFLFTRYSPRRVNDPKTKLGYLFGSFFIISRTVYEKIGTHESVKSEILEDGELGKKLKELGYRLKLFRGEDLVSAYWARDFNTLWNALKRLMVPIYTTNKKNSILMTMGIFILMVFPFIVFMCSFVEVFIIKENTNNFSLGLLFVFNLMSVLSIYLTNYFQLRLSHTHNVLYSLGTIVGCIIVSISFIWSIVTFENKGIITWRDRVYRYGT